MQLDISQILYQKELIHLILNDRGNCIEYKGVSYFTLDDFLVAYPNLISAKEVKILTLTSNFFFGGLQYSLIEDIAAFQKKYKKRILAETSEKASEGFNVSQYGGFNVSKITPPHLAGDILTYFVESVNFGIPYQATCVLPAKDRQASCSYSLLPYELD